MRIANVDNYKSGQLYDTMKVTDVPLEQFRMSMLTEKDRLKAIRTVENIVRTSLEYRDYVKFLKDNIDMTKCTYFNNVTNDNRKRVSIEIHHEPFTLFDITEVVMAKQLSSDNPFDEFMIAEEVMKVHYMGLVGLLPLSKTVHELVHEGQVFIPLQVVYGDFIGFLETYDKYISDDIRTILQTKLSLSKELQDTTVLNKKFVYLEVDGFNLPQPIELKDK